MPRWIQVNGAQGWRNYTWNEGLNSSTRSTQIFHALSWLFANYKISDIWSYIEPDRGEIHMATIGMSVDISALVEATIAEDGREVIAIARELLRSGAPAAELAARVGLIVAHGDSDGHAILTLDAAAALSRWMIAVPAPPEG